MNCFFNTLYDRLKQTRLVSVLFYHGKRYEHFEEITITGIAKDCEHVQRGDGDRCFDVVQPQLGTNAPATVWHCEATPCSPALARRKAQQVREGEKLQVSGTRTFDPPHDALGIHLGGGLNEVHPVKAITFLLALLMLAAPSLRAQSTSYAYAPTTTSAVQYVAVNCGQRTLSSGATEYIACTDSDSGLSWGDAVADVATAASIINASAQGGTIHIGAGNYTFASGVTFTKPARIMCAPGGATTITYTGTSGAAFTLAWGAQPSGPGAGVYGCRFLGPGSTTSTVAIQVSTSTQQVDGAIIQGNYIGAHNNLAVGFGTGILEPTTSAEVQMVSLISNTIQDCGIGIDAFGENTSIRGGSVGENTTSLKVEANTDVMATGVSFDSDTGPYLIVAANGQFSGTVHFETNQVAFAADGFVENSGTVELFGGQMLDDLTTGTQTSLAVNTSANATFDAFGTLIFSAGQAVSEAVDFTAGGGQLYFFNNSATTIPLEYVNGGPARVISFPTRSDSANATAYFGLYKLDLCGWNGSAQECGLFDPSALTANQTYTFPNATGTIGLQLWGQLTTTAATSDNLTITGVTTSSKCGAFAANASAATNIATTYVSAVSANTVTVTHTATANMIYNVSCSVN